MISRQELSQRVAQYEQSSCALFMAFLFVVLFAAGLFSSAFGWTQFGEGEAPMGGAMFFSFPLVFFTLLSLLSMYMVGKDEINPELARTSHQPSAAPR